MDSVLDSMRSRPDPSGSGNPPSLCQVASIPRQIECFILIIGIVLHIVYDKLANPSPDDPYEADIAAVS